MLFYRAKFHGKGDWEVEIAGDDIKTYAMDHHGLVAASMQRYWDSGKN